MKTTTLKLISFTALGVAALAVQSARADMIFDLSTANTTLDDSGPYVQVDVDLTSSTTATVTFTSLTAENSANTGLDINLMGATGAVGLNVSGAFQVGTVTGVNGGTGFTPGPYTVTSGNEDGFGSFDVSINSFDGYMHSADTITVDLSLTSGNWASASDVLTGNSNGDLAAAHVLPAAFPADSTTQMPGNGATGFVTGTGASTPLPDGGSTMIMLGTALIALAKGRSWLARV